MPQVRATESKVYEQLEASHRSTLGYSRRRFLWTWLAVALLAILVALAVWLSVETAKRQNATTTDLANTADNSAGRANDKTNNVYLYLRGERGLPGVPGADGKPGTPGQPGSNPALLPP